MHIGLIPDGNRRWAKENNKTKKEGHEVGAKKIIDFIRWCWEKEEIDEVSIYILSYDNIKKRDKEELESLYTIFESFIDNLFDEFKGKYLISIAGEIKTLLNELKLKNIELYQLHKKSIEKAKKIIKEMNKYNTDKKLNLLIGYKSQKEIVNAARKFDKGNIEDFKNHLYVKRDVDLIIRYGKETRLSDFLLFQSAYAEIFFINKYWPESSRDDFERILAEFKKKERRFGK